MKPVDQTIFGDKKGNCFAACIATILEVPLESLPNFAVEFTGDDWAERMAEWLMEHLGVSVINVEVKDEASCLRCLNGVEHVVGGKSPRGDFGHCVVAVGGKVVHDPHPSRAGLLEVWDYTLFVAPHPSAVVVRAVAEAQTL